MGVDGSIIMRDTNLVSIMMKLPDLVPGGFSRFAWNVKNDEWFRQVNIGDEVVRSSCLDVLAHSNQLGADGQKIVKMFQLGALKVVGYDRDSDPVCQANAGSAQVYPRWMV